MTNRQQKILPSREQIVAAIYETVLRPQLFDRFCAAQQSGSFLQAKPISDGPNPIFEAPELQAHFARALEILEQQWVQMNRPNPVKIWSGPAVPGWEDAASQDEEAWILVTLDGDLLQPRAPQSDACFSAAEAARDLLSCLQRASRANKTWQSFVDQIGSQEFCWQDILVLETPEPSRKLLCRPVWVGDEGGSAGFPVAISVEQLEVHWPLSASSYIAETFGLNHREIQNLRSFVQGFEQDQHQLQALSRVAAKAGAPGLVELVRLVGFLLQEHANDMAIATGRRLPPSLQIRDGAGHETQCFRLGAETGQPVIFIHGTMDGIAGVQHLQPMLRTGGFRVYAPLRGGYGASHPTPKKHQQLDACVAQIEALIEQENLQRPLLLGHRSGVIFARAAALRLRDRVGGLVGVAPTLPLRQVRHYRQLQRHYRALALCARFAPPLASLVLKGWNRFVQKQGASELVRNRVQSGSRGWDRLRGMKLDEVLSLSLKLMMQQGGDGVLSDLRLAPQDWQDQMIGHGGQTVYLCGAEDGLVRDQGLYPQVVGAERVQLRICSEAGDVFLYACPKLVLAALEDLSMDQVQEFSQVS